MTGAYCAQCGQHAIDYRRSFGRVVLDILDSFLNWDSRFFFTLGLLMTRPWRLTTAFLRGQRVRYVHPLRLYLLISIAFFFGAQQLAKHANINSHDGNINLGPQKQKTLEEDLAKLPPQAQAEIRDTVAKAPKDKPFVLIGDNNDPKTQNPFEKWLFARIKEKIGENGVNVKVFVLTVISNLPAMMLCCIPLFAFVLKLLYIRKGVFYIDHLIYALHIHAFAYLAILMIGFGSAGATRLVPGVSGLITAALILASVTLLLFSVRRVYRQSWFMSFFKFALGGVIYLLVLCLAIGATFFVTLALPD